MQKLIFIINLKQKVRFRKFKICPDFNPLDHYRVLRCVLRCLSQDISIQGAGKVSHLSREPILSRCPEFRDLSPATKFQAAPCQFVRQSTLCHLSLDNWELNQRHQLSHMLSCLTPSRGSTSLIFSLTSPSLSFRT